MKQNKASQKRYSISHIIALVVLAYIAYVVLTALIPFLFVGETEDSYFDEHPTTRFYGTAATEGNDRIALLETPLDAGRMRLQLIEEATTSLDISYHTIADGPFSDMFFDAILRAADRGVQVRFLNDAILGGLIGKLAYVRTALLEHPNIQVGFYEPFNIFTPWRWNNRLHDKYLVADKKVAIMGGRNITDKLFTQDQQSNKFVFDRDVLLVRGSDADPSVIDQILEYDQLLWSQGFIKAKTSNEQSAKGLRMQQRLSQAAAQAREEYPQFVPSERADYVGMTTAVRKITLVHNPMGRGSKAPWVWDEMMALFDDARYYIFLQSPYIVPLKGQLQQLQAIADRGVLVNFLTNSPASTPNIPGYSGYLRSQQKLMGIGNVFEYMGPGSIHAKTALMDDRISIIGSFNLDPRSLHLDTESMLVIDSEAFNTTMRGVTAQWIAASSLVLEDGVLAPPANPATPIREPSMFKRMVLRSAQYLTWPMNVLI